MIGHLAAFIGFDIDELEHQNLIVVRLPVFLELRHIVWLLLAQTLALSVEQLFLGAGKLFFDFLRFLLYFLLFAKVTKLDIDGLEV